MDLNEEAVDGAYILHASGRLDSNTAPILEAALPERVKEKPVVILDLANVPYVSSAGLRVLLKGAKTAKASGHKLILTGLAKSVQEVFDISGFTSIFVIAPTVDDARSTLS
ncbi:STAS domain-containing protein [Parasphingorhabdus sp. JC815]|uniref:STAS domain-containing protein n=1 Tax=Parasphingorhabdus sp. JC815 TaxID=3232140 RepID=UPI0034599962